MVLALTMISTELAEKRICVVFYSLVLHECGFQQYCFVNSVVSNTPKRIGHLSGIKAVKGRTLGFKEKCNLIAKFSCDFNIEGLLLF